MDHPGGARQPLAHPLLASQAGIQPDEVERGADPHDADHDMSPAQGEADPVGDDRVHGDPLLRTPPRFGEGIMTSLSIYQSWPWLPTPLPVILLKIIFKN